MKWVALATFTALALSACATPENRADGCRSVPADCSLHG